ncbi:MAG TPA: alkaline phosphatase family protein [Candidatus Brocadiia bacterium]|nr:alkaline phosphatase family protein [Candidatus Brocadiales bacterium]
MQSTNKKRVFCIGLDGATFDLINPWVREGKLPNLKRFMEEGTHGVLRSVIQPFSPQAWGSFMTGVNPGKHGVFGFKEQIKGAYDFQFVNNKSIKVKTLWKILSEQGKKVIVVNIPMTYPPEEVNGILVGGMDSPGVDSDFTFPREIKDEILNVTKNYMVHLHVAGYLNTDAKRRKAINDLISMTEYREKMVLYLMNKYEWDFFAVNFAAADQAQHHFWRYMTDNGASVNREFKEAILRIYQRLDEAVGKLTANLDKDVIQLIISDHGSGPISDVVIYIDEWLRRKELLAFKTNNTRANNPLSKIKLFVKSCGRSFAEWLRALLFKHLSSRTKDALQRFFPKMRSRAATFINRSVIDWGKTKVYSSENVASLRINLIGREPRGIVNPGTEYEELRENLIRDLESIEHPLTKERLIERVYKREELYVGPYTDGAPDLIIWPKDGTYKFVKKIFPKGANRQPITIDKRNGTFTSGTHKLNGIFIARGSDVLKNNSILPIDIVDIFPTVLYCLGLEIPGYIDGKVITGMFSNGYIFATPVRYSESNYNIETRGPLPDTIQTYKDSESKQIEERLKGLGYLE